MEMFNFIMKIIGTFFGGGVFITFIILIFKIGGFVKGSKITEERVSSFEKVFTSYQEKEETRWEIHEKCDTETKKQVAILSDNMMHLLELQNEQNAKFDNLIANQGRIEGYLEGMKVNGA